VARLACDLSLAEDCAQEACAAALAQWPSEGVPANPGGWVVAVARRRALDHLRRESARAGKERQAVQEWTAAEPDGSAVAGDDQLALLFACCHPALDPASRVTLTLRVVCGLPAASDRPAAVAARADCRSADRAGEAEDPRRGHPAARA
jgi:RNA polymerase sigma-70 factor (ECF subfamily)